MVFPPIHWFQGLSGRKTLSDIEFMSKKEFDGKLVKNTGTQNDGGTGNCATLTASSGKDLYLAKAKVTVRLDATTIIIVGEVTLVANGTVIDRWYFSGAVDDTTSTTGEMQHEFKIIGIKVDAAQTIVLDVVASNADYDIQGTLLGFEETTGETPVI